jgi:lysophospholipase L1-like esterase
MEANESYSGATISYTGYDGLDFADRSFITRLPRVGSPDVLVILGGTNDSWAGAPVGEYKYEDFQTEDLYYYRPALAKLLQDAKQRYPKARLLFVMNSELREDITESSMEICAHYSVPFLQLYDIEKKAGHPNVEGMKSIASQVLSALQDARYDVTAGIHN